jgi:hypothetical protein
MFVTKSKSALLVLCFAVGAISTPVEGQDEKQKSDSPWGVEVDGVQCRLRADKLVWHTDEVPTFHVDIRNRSSRQDLSVVLHAASHQVLVDKLVCEWRGGNAPTTPLPPKKQLDAIRFRLDDHWCYGSFFGAPPPARSIGNINLDAKFRLAPGRHTVRVAAYADGEGKSWVRALSNPVEIEVIEPGKKLPPIAVQTSKKVVRNGLALLIRLNKKVFGPEDMVDVSFTLTNESDNAMYIGDGYLGQDYQEAGPTRHFEVHATPADQKPLTFWSGMMTEGETSGIRKVFRLAPGESYDGAIRLAAGAAREMDFVNVRHEERGGSFAAPDDKKHVIAVDARRYSVSLVYQVDPMTHFPHLPPAEFKDQILWKGRMASEPLTFEVMPRNGK